MAKKILTVCTCDLCCKEGKTKEVALPVRFLTEQTEGRAVKPYIEFSKIDLCSDCLEKITVVNAHGIQGNNEYYIDKAKLK